MLAMQGLDPGKHPSSPIFIPKVLLIIFIMSQSSNATVTSQPPRLLGKSREPQILFTGGYPWPDFIFQALGFLLSHTYGSRLRHWKKAGFAHVPEDTRGKL